MKNIFKIEKINEEDCTIRVARLCIQNVNEYYQGNHDVFERATVEYKENEEEQKQVIATHFNIDINTIELI